MRPLPGLLLGLFLAGCATGRDPRRPRDGQELPESSIDQGAPDGPADVFPWPDRRPPDLPVAADLAARDRIVWPDAGKPCPDIYEANESCAAAANAGEVQEGGGWASVTATLDPSTDQDWFTATAREKSHTCVPFTSQCYVLRVQTHVPAGRVFRLCVQRESCTAVPSCAGSLSQPGPNTLEVEYTVNGTCSLNDDTIAKIFIKSLDGKGGCLTYTTSFRYDEC